MLPGKTYSLEDVLYILKAKVWVLLLPFAIVAAGTALVVRHLPDRYRSETVILVVPQRVPESYVRSTVTTRIEDRLQSLAQQILSRTRLERIIEDLNLYPEERRTGIMEDVVEKMRKDISVEVLRGDSFRISYLGENPRTVMRVTERLASLFIEENLRDREVLADDTNQFLEAQLEDARRRLVEQEKKVEAYRKQFSGQLPSQLDSNLQVLQNAELQVQAIVESINRDRDRRIILERQIADLNEQREELNPLPADSPVKQLEAARAALTDMQRRYTPNHPDIQRISRVIKDLEQKVEQEGSDGSAPEASPTVGEVARRKRLDDLRVEMDLLDRQLAQKQNDEKQLRTLIAGYQKRVEVTPTRESEMTELTRDYVTLQDLYKNLLAKKEESKMAANLERRQIGEQFKLLDPARVAEKPTSPNRPLLSLVGVVSGLGVGLALVIWFEYRDRSFKTDHEIARILSVPVLAVVPLMQTATERRWAFRKRIVFGLGFGTTVLACIAIVIYTLVY